MLRKTEDDEVRSLWDDEVGYKMMRKKVRYKVKMEMRNEKGYEMRRWMRNEMC